MHTEQVPVKKNKLKKWLKRIVIYTAISLLVLVGAAVLATYLFEDEIKQYAVTQINKEIKTQIEVKDIRLSLFRKFPYASLEFMNVKCREASRDSSNRNLLEAESVFLQFSVWDLLHKKYTFKRLDIKNGKAFIHIEKDGYRNFDILKEKKTEKKKKTQKNDAFSFDRFSIQNMKVAFLNDPDNQEYRVDIRKFTLSGKFSAKKHTTRSNGEFFVEMLRIGENEFMTNKKVSISTKFDVDAVKKLFTIQKCKVGIENMNINADGYFRNDSTKFLDLKVEGSQLNIQSFLSLMPSDKRNFEKEYKSKGNFYVNAIIKGSVAKGNTPFYAVYFGIDKGQVTHKPSNVALKDIELKGSFTNGKKHSAETTELVIEQLSARLTNSSIKGDFRIVNMDNPEMQFSTDSRIDLRELSEFLPIGNIEAMEGLLDIRMKFSGKSTGSHVIKGQNFHFTIHDYQKSQMEGTARLTGFMIQIKGQKNRFHQCNGSLTFVNSDATIENLTGMVGLSDFSVKGTVKNLPGYLLLPDAPLTVNASFSSGKIMLDEWLETEKQTSRQKDKKAYALTIPERINFDLDIQADELKFRKFTATGIRGNVSIQNRLFGANHVSFNSCGGTIFVNGVVNGTDTSNLKMTAHAQFNDINIKELFTEFENFGQKTLEDKHLNGTVNATTDFSCIFSNALIADMKTLYASATIRISNGQLTNFKPMEALSRFIKVDELRDIKFAELKNTIEIKDEKIIIPQMEVNSSAINIILSGEHHFDNTIDYHFNVLLKDLLAQKFKRNKKEDEFGEIIEEEGGARIFIKMTGPADDPVISYDGKSVRQKIKDDLKKENQNLKQMLFEEFGLFSKDSTIKKDKQLPKKENKNKVKDSDGFEFE